MGRRTSTPSTSGTRTFDLNQEFTYDRRNRLASWKHQGATKAYAFDDLGNLTSNADSAQTFDVASRPHAIHSRANGNAVYTHDADGNVTSIVSSSSSRFFQFDSSNRMICADSVQDGCGLHRLHYDVDGRRVLDDSPMTLKFVAFVDDDVNLDGGLDAETRIEIRAFGERIAYKRSGDNFRSASVGAPWGLPPVALELLAGFGVLGLLVWAARRGTLVLVLERPGYAGIAAVLVVALVVGPVPGARVSKAGGGGGASFYWELADRLGTGMVMVDETGARRVHRTYSPFGVETASVGTASWLPSHYAGHLEDPNAGLVYMQARWMDPQSGTFLGVDPVVSNAGDPQAFNAYAYARNNPSRFTDPSGQWIEPDSTPGCQFIGFTEGLPTYVIYGSGITIDLGIGLAGSGTGASGGGAGGLGSLGLGDLGGGGVGGGLNSGGGVGGVGGVGAASQHGGSQSAASVSGSNVAGGGLVGSGSALLYSTAYENNPTRSGQARLGTANPASRYGWDRSFHFDFDNRSGFHFNAELGPLQRFNHARIPGSLYRLGSTSALRALGRGLVVGGLAFDAYDLATAGPGGYGRALGGIAGGWGGALGGAAIGSAIAPGPGTVIGGFVGGVIGSFGGQYAGDGF